MADNNDGKVSAQEAIDASLMDNIRMIVGGIATLVAIVVPVLLIRKLVSTVENSQGFKSIEDALK